MRKTYITGWIGACIDDMCHWELLESTRYGRINPDCKCPEFGNKQRFRCIKCQAEHIVYQPDLPKRRTK